MSFHNQHPQSPSACLSTLTSIPNLTYLAHGPATITLTSPTGPRTRFNVFGSPLSPTGSTGSSAARPWAFTYPRMLPEEHVSLLSDDDNYGGSGGDHAGQVEDTDALWAAI